MSIDRDGRLLGILVTYRRPVQLAETIRRLAEQERPAEVLIVVDNDPTPETGTEALVRRASGEGMAVEYVASGENLGPAGGIALGMRRVLEIAGDQDWVVLLDDDDPPLSPTWLQELLAFGRATAARDPSLGGVGFGGGRFRWARAKLVRPPFEQFDRGPVAVDYIAGNHLPLYRVGAVRSVGTFAPELFFGLDDLEFGLRLRRGGFSLYGLRPDREVARRERAKLAHMVEEKKRTIGLRYRLPPAPDWREYYALRNTVYILRSHGRPGTALRVALVRGLLKPAFNGILSPRRALRHLRLRSKAAWHGLVGRMGRTVEPQTTPPP